MQRGLKFVASQLKHNTYTNIIERKSQKGLDIAALSCYIKLC